jgi:hypothetical protein
MSSNLSLFSAAAKLFIFCPMHLLRNHVMDGMQGEAPALLLEIGWYSV